MQSVVSARSIDSDRSSFIWDVVANRSKRRESELERTFSPAPSRSSMEVMVDKGRCNAFVDSKCLEAIVTCTVLCNALQMGLEADYPGYKRAWVVGENIATSVFFCEMVLKIIAKKRGYFLERSNWLDAVLTILGVIDCWVLALVPGDTADLQSMSILRILRFFRLARVSKIARKIKAIVLVFTGLYRALESTFWVLVGLVVIMFVFAVFCTEFIGRPEAGIYPGFSRDSEVIDEQEVMTNYNPHLMFGSMRSSMFTLFSIAIGNEWSEIVRPLAIKQPLFVAVFLLYCIIIVFGIMNVIIAIVVDNVIEESKKLDHEADKAQREEKRNLLNRIQSVLGHLDGSSNGQITYDEVKAAFAENTEFRDLLQSCDFPAGWTARELLNLLDSNGDGSLEKSEFTYNVFRLMDSGDFQQLCMLQSGINQVKHLVRRSHSKLERQIKDVKEAVRRSEAMRFTIEQTNITADSTAGDTQLTSADAEEHVCQTGSKALRVGFSEPLGDGLVSPSPAERSTSSQFTLGLSSDEALQHMRDLVERTEAIVKTDSRSHAAVEKGQQPLTQAGREATSLQSTMEREQLIRAPTVACPDAVCLEFDHKIKRLSCKEFADILESALATMRETLHKEVALPAQGEDMPFLSPRDTIPQASCVQVQAMNNSDQECPSARHALDVEPSCSQATEQMMKLREFVHRALPSCSAAPPDKVLPTGEILNLRTSL